MMTATNWWETIFSGNLKIGINEQKTYQLEDESFLYLTTPPLQTVEMELENATV